MKHVYLLLLNERNSVLGKEEERQMFQQMQALAQKQVDNTL
jgi:hypothetical protein